jgi:hypothetical protein
MKGVSSHVCIKRPSSEFEEGDISRHRKATCVGSRTATTSRLTYSASEQQTPNSQEGLGAKVDVVDRFGDCFEHSCSKARLYLHSDMESQAREDGGQCLGRPKLCTPEIQLDRTPDQYLLLTHLRKPKRVHQMLHADSTADPRTRSQNTNFVCLSTSNAGQVESRGREDGCIGMPKPCMPEMHIQGPFGILSPQYLEVPGGGSELTGATFRLLCLGPS